MTQAPPTSPVLPLYEGIGYSEIIAVLALRVKGLKAELETFQSSYLEAVASESESLENLIFELIVQKAVIDGMEAFVKLLTTSGKGGLANLWSVKSHWNLNSIVLIALSKVEEVRELDFKSPEPILQDALAVVFSRLKQMVSLDNLKLGWENLNQVGAPNPIVKSRQSLGETLQTCGT